MPIVTIVATTTPQTVAPGQCTHIASGVIRFTAAGHVLTIIFSEVEVSRSLPWQLAKRIQATAQQHDDFHEGLIAFSQQHPSAEWDRKHRILTVEIRP